MKHFLMALMTVVMAVTFSASAFAGEEDEKKKGKKGKYTNVVFSDEKKDEKKKDGK